MKLTETQLRRLVRKTIRQEQLNESVMFGAFLKAISKKNKSQSSDYQSHTQKPDDNWMGKSRSKYEAAAIRMLKDAGLMTPAGAIGGEKAQDKEISELSDQDLNGLINRLRVPGFMDKLRRKLGSNVIKAEHAIK